MHSPTENPNIGSLGGSLLEDRKISIYDELVRSSSATIYNNTKEKWKQLKQVFNVNPFVMFYVLGTTMGIPALDNLEMKLSCLANLDFGIKVCDSIRVGLNETKSDNRRVQVVIVNMYSWQKPLEIVMPIITIFFLGYFTDLFRIRKPFLLMPVAGEIISMVGAIVCYEHNLRVEILGLTRTVLPSFFGGQLMFRVALISQVSDGANYGSGMFKIISAMIQVEVATAITMSFSGIMFRHTGTRFMLYATLGVISVTFFFGVVYIRERSNAETRFPLKQFCTYFICPRYFCYSFSIILKKKENNCRYMIWMILFITFVISGTVQGEATLLFLYSQYHYSWTVVEFSWYSALATTSNLLGTFLLVPNVRKYHMVNDYAIIFAALANKIVTNILIIFIPLANVLYIFAASALIQPLWIFGVQSLSQKFVSSDDLTKMNSLVSLAVVLSKASFVPLYDEYAYIYFMDGFHEAFFYAGIMLNSAAIILTFFTWGLNKLVTYIVKEVRSPEGSVLEMSHSNS